MKDKMPPARFRRQLKEQLPILESEGLLTGQQSQSLFARYQLDALSSEATNTLLMAIYTIGAVLISIGIISFVAAHWEAIPRTVKIITIFSVMLTAHLSGFYLWQIRGSYPKLGHTLVLLGTLIFGANIGLMAQIFHVQSNPFNGFFVWSIGALLLAYAVKSVPNAVLAVIVAAIAALSEIEHYPNHPPFWFPLAVIVMFVPFIYYTRSRWVLCTALLLLTILLPVTFACWDADALGAVSGFALAGLLFYGWAVVSQQHDTTRFIAPAAFAFGVFLAALATYLCSFHELTDELIDNWHDFSFMETYNITIMAGIILLLSLALTVKALFGRIKLIQIVLLTLIAANLAVIIILPGFVSFFEITVIANLLLILLIILLFITSFSYEDRRIFWSAVLMAAILILSRTLEYETELLIKAIIFTTCGVGIIVAGVMFERFLKARRLSHA